MSSEKVEIINLPNKLRKKVTIGGPNSVSPEVLERAEKAIQILKKDYLNWVEDDLKKIDIAYHKLLLNPENDVLLQNVYKVAHDIKGQGGSFGYDMMTEIGQSLCQLIEKMKTIGPNELEIIGVHTDAMGVVIHDRIERTGGDTATAMLKGLEKVCIKYKQEKNNKS